MGRIEELLHKSLENVAFYLPAKNSSIVQVKPISRYLYCLWNLRKWNFLWTWHYQTLQLQNTIQNILIGTRFLDVWDFSCLKLSGVIWSPVGQYSFTYPHAVRPDNNRVDAQNIQKLFFPCGVNYDRKHPIWADTIYPLCIRQFSLHWEPWDKKKN